jgi:indole-3-glycerol phosphate synthase
VSRFSEAISEGDGISVIPVLEGDVGALAHLAEEAGAEAVAVRNAGEAAAARAATGLPVLVRGPELALEDELRLLAAPDADACVVAYERLSGEEALERVYSSLAERGIDCVVGIRDEDELEEALERADPEIILISELEPARDVEDLERTLDLLPDVPAGKLVVSEARVVAREQVVALERAGVDAILVGADVLRSPDFSSALAALTGR